MKQCKACGELKDTDDFPKKGKIRYSCYCLICDRKRYRAWYASNKERVHSWYLAKIKAHPTVNMLDNARRRARRKQLPFSITEKDIPVPTRCPVLGVQLAWGRRKQTDASPSLDRLRPELGYIPGNVNVISLKANAMKNSGNLDEHKRLVAWMRKKGL